MFYTSFWYVKGKFQKEGECILGIRDNFKKGSVEMLILTLLNEEDMYGYQLSQLIAERSNHILTIPEGSMYPTLYRLVDNGYITGRRELVGRRQSRVYYHIEESGKERLKALWKEYHLVCDGIQSISELSAPIE